MSAELGKALRLVMNLLPDHGITEDLIREHAEEIVLLLARRGEAPDVEELIRRVEASVNIRQEVGPSLIDREGHVDWLLERRAEDVWDYWDRYRIYLEDTQSYPRAVVLRLDEVTDSIFSKLEDPRRLGSWDRRGLVVGQVQSGKTSNYTGLICKAADAGYKLIVVLAGIHNSLRSQTQLRLDEGFLGFDSQAQTRSDDQTGHHFIGVGALPGVKRLRAGSLTTSTESGDFRMAKAQSLALPIGNMPVLLVVKKHSGIIRNIHQWITTMHGEFDEATQRKIVHDVPVLVIDDEADNASIDTSKEEAQDPTAINRELRRLLHAFDKSAYVGYTATPFANIYADPYEKHELVGEDIFPRSFIEVLRAPSNYFGPERVFGLIDDERGAIPIHQAIEDHQKWMPDGHKKFWRPQIEAFPNSLRMAMLDFVLSCAARRVRGQAASHSSMLIHVTRFQDVQERVHDQVKELLLLIKDRLRHGDAGSGESVRDELRRRWQESFVPTTKWFAAEDERLQTLTWEQIAPQLLPAVTKIEIRTMNGRSRDALDYYEKRDLGLSVIAIGGDKLSRGLTLEGLTVSYYLRASKMYDTLMQMGRWFGFRPEYEDLCRLYTTPDLRAWYREITLASDELRAELEEMAAQGATPIEYGLRVRTSPAGLSVTAANKMRRAQKVRLSFSGSSPETVLFDTRSPVLQGNREALERLIAAQGPAHRTTESGNLAWSGDVGDDVVQFFDRYRSDPMAWRVRPDLIANYIRQGMQAGELDEWTIVLVSNNTGQQKRTVVDGNDIGLTKRSLISDGETGRRERELRDEHRWAIRRILSPVDEFIDLSVAQVKEALAATLTDFAANPGSRTQAPTTPSGPAIRRTRRPGQALLLIYVLSNEEHSDVVETPMVGFFLSFPHAEHDIAAEYAVNPVWRHLQADGLSFEDDDS